MKSPQEIVDSIDERQAKRYVLGFIGLAVIQIGHMGTEYYDLLYHITQCDLCMANLPENLKEEFLETAKLLLDNTNYNPVDTGKPTLHGDN